MQTDALWASLNGGGTSQTEALKEQSGTAAARPQGSKPTASMNWSSLCRPVAKPAAAQDRNRVSMASDHPASATAFDEGLKTQECRHAETPSNKQ